jgi:tetratricopeptide (TPR) repeat protein
MEKLLILFLSFLHVSAACFSQEVTRCNSNAFQDSLVEVYSKKARQFGYNHPQWEASWDSLLVICPNVSDAYREKAIPYLKSADYARAFELEDKAVELDPEKWIAYRGFLHCIFTKNYEKALADFDRAEKLVPNANIMDHTYSFYLGLSYLGLAEYAQAEQAFLKDITQQRRGNGNNDPHFNSLLYLGIVYYEIHEYGKAEKALKNCLRLYKQLPEANYYLALTFKSAGNSVASYYFEKAGEYYNLGYRLNEDNEPYANYPRQISQSDLKRK